MENLALKEQVIINTRLLLSMTDKAFTTLHEIFKDKYRDFLREFSEAKSLLISTSGESKYDIHFKGYVIACAISDDQNGFVIKHIKKEDFNSQNQAISNSLLFRFAMGLCVKFVSTKYKIFCEFVNGVYSPNTNQSKFNYSAALTIVVNRLNQIEGDDYQTSEELEDWLTLAENYSDIESMIAESRVKADGGITYKKITPLDYNRTDRLAYRFIVKELKDLYKKNARVEIENRFDQPVSAKIMTCAKNEKGEYYMDLLFNRQFDINTLCESGTIRLSFSTVTKDVQQQAISAIRNNEAAAKYFDNVLGKNKPQGFDENLDLSQLEEYYKDENKTNYDYKKSFPPNASQIKAITNGIKSKDAFLVMGPPGTGKTTVILEWVKYFITQKNLRVLVSSQTNKAVDNVIERIVGHDGVDILRIGSEDNLQENVKDCMYENKISTLRQKIAVSTKSNSEIIEAQINLWKNRQLQFDSLKVFLKEVGKNWVALENEINGKLLPLHDSICKLINDINLIQQEIKNLSKKMQQKLVYETKKNNAGNFVVQFFYSFVFFFCKFSLKRNAFKIRELISKERWSISDYQDKLAKYKKSYYEIATGVFVPYQQASEQYITNAEKVFSASQTDEDARAFGMFNFEANPLSFKLVAQLEKIENNITLEIERAQKTIDAIKTWGTDMQNEQTYALEKLVLESVNLVGATCIGINSQRRFNELEFDVTIIDESGQIQIQNALVPMSLSNKLIMLGDHKQIPPLADDDVLNACAERDVESTLLEKSLFEVMYNRLPDENKQMLDTQFRMPAEIADTLSEWFYQSNYLSSDHKRNLRSIIPALSEKPFVVIDTSDSPERYEKVVKNPTDKVDAAANAESTEDEEQGKDGDKYNDFEGEIIVDLVKRLEKEGFDLSQVGVIAGLREQARRTKKKLIDAGFNTTLVNEMVATLDSFQGQERDVIIFSFTRSSKKPPHKIRVGFLAELRRINVAMSRSKQTLIMIGDLPFLSSCECTLDWKGNETEYDKTEKNFSEFIRKMVSDITDKNRGEIIKSAEFKRRIESEVEN